MTSQESQCPWCDHSSLNHKHGQCLVIVKLKNHPDVPARGEPTKAHCGCTYYPRVSGQWELDL